MEYIPRIYKGDDEPFVFISYSHKDDTAVYADLAVLEKRHVRFWYDYGIPPGPEWDRVVREIIMKPNCTGAIFYFSRNSLGSEAVQKEIGFFREKLDGDATFSYVPYFAVLTDHERFSDLFYDAMRSASDRFLDVAEIITRLFNSRSKFILHPAVSKGTTMPAYYDALVAGVDVFSAREADEVRGQYRCDFDAEVGGAVLYPAPGAAETERLLPDALLGCRVLKIGDDAFRDDGALYRVEIPYGVRFIGDRAFSGCSSLAEVILPDTVEEIGESAFSGCRALSRLVLPASLTTLRKNAFYGCSALAEAVLPEGLRAVPSGCYKGCTSLGSAVLPEGLTEIGAEAFYGAAALREIRLPESLVRIGREAFRACGITRLLLPGTVSEVNECAFADCVALREAVLASPREVVARGLLQGCTALTALTLPDTVTELRESALEGCAALAALALPAALVDVGDRALLGCASLTALDLPEGVTRLGRQCLAGASALAGLHLPSTLERIGAMAFLGCASLCLSLSEGRHGFRLAEGVLYAEDGAELVTVDSTVSKRLVIPEGVALLRPGALSGRRIAEVSMPDSLTEIGQYVFFGVEEIVSVSVGSGVKKIGNGNFSACPSLRSVTLPDTVQRFGGNLFRDCARLSRIVYHAAVPHELGLCCFVGTAALAAVSVSDRDAVLRLRGWEDVAHLIVEEGGRADG